MEQKDCLGELVMGRGSWGRNREEEGEGEEREVETRGI